MVKVLVADDDEDQRFLISRVLQRAGFQTIPVENGADVVSIARAERPDVILLDVDMPGMSGLQLIRELRPRLPDTQIVMLSVSGDDRNVLEAMRHGAVGYLTKDLGPEALQRAVRGIRKGDLAMSRRMAARTLKRFIEGGAAEAGADSALSALSSRELQVLGNLADGLTDREIADALVISPRTVESHVSSILRKLEVRNRAEAALRYREARSADEGPTA